MRASRRSFAIASCSVLWLGAASAGCSRASPGSGVPSPSTTHAAPGPDAAASGPSAQAPGADASGDPLLTADVVKAKSVGHTSYVLKLTLDGGTVAVWKPRSRLPLGDRRYRGEIAAYRLARALALVNVPRQEPRSFPADALHLLQPDFDAKALPDPDGRVRGAIGPWIERYEVLPLEQASARAGWEPWLTDAHVPVPFDQRALARALTNLVVFDYVTGNWDRWSGGNVARDGATGTVLYVDNDGAFYDPPPPDSLARQLALLRRVVRFSRGLVAMLRALDEAKLRTVFGEEAPGVPLLSDRVIAGVDQRRRTVLDLVDLRLRSAPAAPDGGDAVTFDFE